MGEADDDAFDPSEPEALEASQGCGSPDTLPVGDTNPDPTRAAATPEQSPGEEAANPPVVRLGAGLRFCKGCTRVQHTTLYIYITSTTYIGSRPIFQIYTVDGGNIFFFDPATF